jgi:hypothetical protein
MPPKSTSSSSSTATGGNASNKSEQQIKTSLSNLTYQLAKFHDAEQLRQQALQANTSNGDLSHYQTLETRCKYLKEHLSVLHKEINQLIKAQQAQTEQDIALATKANQPIPAYYRTQSITLEDKQKNFNQLGEWYVTGGHFLFLNISR